MLLLPLLRRSEYLWSLQWAADIVENCVEERRRFSWEEMCSRVKISGSEFSTVLVASGKQATA